MQPTLLCLHGWGGSKESFTELREALKDSDIQIFTPDLPGFGDEPEPKTAWTVDDYADWVEKYCALHIQGPFMLLGHSHGGRISMKLALRKKLPITHLYLVASAGIKHPRHIKRMVGLTLAKGGKTVLSIPGLKGFKPLAEKMFYKLVRVHDYEKASPIMRETLINVTAEDFRAYLSSISIPTDIIWGSADGVTPVGDSDVIHQGIKGSRVHVFEGIRHRVHRDKAKEIAAIIKNQL